MDELFKQLVVPLLGGFLYIWVNYRARFLLLPAGGEKFFLACGVLGAFGLLFATLIAHAIKVSFEFCPVPWVHDLHRQWHQWIPFSLAQVIALLGLPIFGKWQNRRCDYSTAYGLAVATSGDTLEVFFEQAIAGSKLVSLSLHSGRVYVGKIEEVIKPVIGRRHIKIVPFMSGFRWPLDTAPDGATKAPNRIYWSTVYKDVVQGILTIGRSSAGGAKKEPFVIRIPSHSGALVEVDAREMGVVISVDEIETATIFNQRVFAYLNRDRYPFILDKMTGTLKAKQEPADEAAAKAAKGPGD